MRVNITSVYPVAATVPEGLSSSLPNKLNGAIDRRLPGRAVAIAALGWRLRAETRLIYRFEKTVESGTLQTSWDSRRYRGAVSQTRDDSAIGWERRSQRVLRYG